jgi:hypothetical protein
MGEGNRMKLDKIVVVYLFVALARILYGIDGVVSHYMFHFDDFAIATYISAAVGIIIGIALVLPLSKRLALFFASVNAASGLAGFLIMGWIYIAGEEETVINPVLAPLVSAIVFSVLLYLKPMLTEKRKKLK